MDRSEYYLALSGDVKCRYDQKIEIIGNIDPYAIPVVECKFDVLELPNITLMDLVNYLILTHSYYTGQQLKAYKSLQAYKQFEAGSVQGVLAKQINDEAFVVIAKVQHSQRKREKLLQVWIIILKDTSISSAHCTCMAGLSEVCSHVATVLFHLLARPNILEESGPGPSCTEQLALWPVPPMKSVEMMRVQDMDWSKKKTEIKTLSQRQAPCLDKVELCDLLTKLQAININPAICKLMEPFASRMEDSVTQNLPPSLDSWYSPDMVGRSYEELLAISKNLDLNVTEEQSKLIEAATREQCQNSTWFKYRAGRITASRFKAVCRTTIEKPSLTVVKGICYPQKVVFFSKATSYGVKYEKIALEEYRKFHESQHTDFTLLSSGFVISPKYPEVGASPDGVVSCSCCGLGCVEVKCPYLLADDSSLEDFASKKHTCLVSNNGEYSLDRSHCYYYQIQCQMFVTERNYCDFVVWSKNFMFIERILCDTKFCLENIKKALDFHNYVIRPELLARYFTEKGGMGKLTLWCLCQKPDDGRPMLRCDSDNCETQWFHFECINISETPVIWFCENCK